MADIAAARVGEREVTSNQSPFILSVWRESGIGTWGHTQRQPWCAAFVSWCIKQAERADVRCELPFGPTPSVHQWVEFATDAKIPHVRWQEARKGDVVTFLPHLSHIGIVEESVAGGLVTIEGNTGASGGREGDGVWRKQRGPAIIGTVWALPCGLGLK